MKSTISVFSYLLLVILFGCSDDEGPTGSGGSNLSGTVLEKATQQPVSGAAISLGEQSTASDASGNYKLSNVPAVKQALRIEKASYAVFIEDVTPVKGENIVDVELETHAAYCQRVTSVL